MNQLIENIWKGFHTKLRQFIILRISSADDADDILQEVFIRIYKHIETLKDSQKLTSWIFQITRNAIIDYYRTQNEKGDFSIDDLSGKVEIVNAQKRLVPSLTEMVNHLQPIYKEAIILTEFQGIKQKELADKLGISLSGVKSRVQRARQQLKEMLLDCCNFEFDSAGKMCDFSKKMNCCANFDELRKNTVSNSSCHTSTTQCN